MKFLIGVFVNIALTVALLTISTAQAQNDTNTLILNGAGATFPAPLYKKWIATYHQVEPATLIKYAEVGSGEGVNRFLADTVDFGASDAPMTDTQITAAPRGAIMVPVAAGMVVLAYNLPGLNGVLKLNRHTYSAVLMGEITRWNDTRIQATNPGLNLPAREIQLVARQDSSGTTFALTNHLSTISAEWRSGPGTGKLVRWPDNTMLAHGNEGVAARVQRSVGSIGYVEYGFAERLGLKIAHLENREGSFVAPNEDIGVTTLAANIEHIPVDMRVYIPDPAGIDSYPLISFTWLLLKAHYVDKHKGEALKHFVTWCLREGQDFNNELGYVRLPKEVTQRSNKALSVVSY